eukprot:CAMPEP_0113873950 /NCGR_PEP_ID=MMETSP0780_2-20120614/4059_1 /TAXON_ID=652834 /ORGANISM="Palpitomonas bilix" /LENGTH=129 /DNA_ID=CAMNT_0000859661 /DNA_START=46 /DNA_END=435 /DNA_ORIENTATION=+ /assembly_acc=CAM_ASM_000599
MAGQVTQQQVIQKFNQLRNETNNLRQKLAELESDAREHELVLNTIKPLDGDRKAYRLVGGVLVERTVAEVLPAVETNKKGLDEVMGKLQQALAAKEKELNDHIAEYKITVKTGAEEGAGGMSASSGVLV